MKKLLSLVLCIMLIVGMCACTQNVARSDAESAEELSFIEEYIRDYDGDKLEFYSFWNKMYSSCYDLEDTLEDMGNENTYAFDPMKAENIPQELAEVVDFVILSLLPEAANHSGYELKINQTAVEFYFDGYCFYPSDKTPTQVQQIAEKYNQE